LKTKKSKKGGNIESVKDKKNEVLQIASEEIEKIFIR
jgi:hypothetical protein